MHSNQFIFFFHRHYRSAGEETPTHTGGLSDAARNRLAEHTTKQERGIHLSSKNKQRIADEERSDDRRYKDRDQGNERSRGRDRNMDRDDNRDRDRNKYQHSDRYRDRHRNRSDRRGKGMTTFNVRINLLSVYGN